MTDQLTAWIETIMTMDFFYPLVALFVMVDSLIPLVPSETILNLSGAWAGSSGEPNIRNVLIWAVIGGVVGDNICYFAGTKLIRYVDKLDPESKGGQAVRWVRRNMNRRAGATIVAARFIPWGRWVTTIILGSVRYRWILFFIFDTIGVIVWALINVGVGFLGGLLFQQFPLIGLIIGVIAGTLVGMLLQKAQNRFFEWRDVKRGFSHA